MTKQKIPIHDFSKDDATSIRFQLSPLEKKSKYNAMEPHRHNYYEIFIFTKGGGYHEIDFERILIESGSVHFVSPGQVHILSRSPESYGYVLMFSRDFYSLNLKNKDILFELPFLNNASSKPYLNLNTKDFAVFFQLLESIKNEADQDSVANEDVIRSYLNILLLKSRNFYNHLYDDSNLNTSTLHVLFYKFRTLVEQNYRTLHLVKEYAELLSTTPEHLNEIIKKISGKTASDVISDRIILEAKRLLLFSEFSNKEIAFFLSYEDPSYFSRFFKNKTGLSPGEFKESIQNSASIPSKSAK
jgi:AraC family transcriptional regulator, transcriptional activator of pobA